MPNAKKPCSHRRRIAADPEWMIVPGRYLFNHGVRFFDILERLSLQARPMKPRSRRRSAWVPPNKEDESAEEAFRQILKGQARRVDEVSSVLDEMQTIIPWNFGIGGFMPIGPRVGGLL